MGKLSVPSEVKKSIPYLITEYCEYLNTTGKFPQAGEWKSSIQSQSNSFLSRLRSDGSFKGETFVKKYSDVNRNSLCPCGSNKKFKKCCLPLIS
ncbi:hypothetical protein CHISP_1676 [Chitinispirillum alkaliphilum]|nr:hypothetical protein CHISP_1676 [Chitinispirillum alkaliphilum]